jgi:hypothetical protein
MGKQEGKMDDEWRGGSMPNEDADSQVELAEELIK